MPKLQKIKRSNGSVVHSVNIPLELIEELGWEKGTKLLVGIRQLNSHKFIILFQEEDELNGQEEING